MTIEYEKTIDIENEDTAINVEMPFDPNSINIKIVPRNIGQLVEMLEDKLIEIPKYQRRPHLWDNIKKSRFIESLMLELPIPLFYFDEGKDKIWRIIDGLQRISTLEQFMLLNSKDYNGSVYQSLTICQEPLMLENLEYLREYNGKSWKELPRTMQRKIKSNQVTINLIGKGTPDIVKYAMFSRINQSTPLTYQEIRTALLQGFKIDFLEQFSQNIFFKQATNYVIKTTRQEDLDFVSRFLSFYLLGYEKYEPDINSFIVKGMHAIPSDEMQQQNTIQAFERAMKLAYTIFETDAFRKRTDRNDTRKPINKPLFEVISVAFSKLSANEIEKLKEHKEAFIDAFIALQKDKTFQAAITTGTAKKESVVIRHTKFKEILNNIIHD